MVKLTDDYQQQAADFQKAGIAVPQYDQTELTNKTLQAPVWIHFGGGNLFRCFHAKIAQDLLNQGALDRGIIVAETFDSEVIEKIYHPANNRMLSVVLKEDGTLDKELLASVAASLYVDHNDPEQWAQLTQYFVAPTLQLVTFSITEKGYSLVDVAGNLTKAAQADIANGPNAPVTNMGIVAHLLYERFQAGKLPLALVSTDNFSQNGLKLQAEVLRIAQGWVDNHLVAADFIDYLTNPELITFPCSMIDRITPSPSADVAQKLQQSGFSDTQILTTAKTTVIAPFANTEEVHYLVIEDNFPNGRPRLEQAGVIMTDRATVNDADQMKVTACLNPLHTALAIFGSLLGFTSIAAEVADADLLGLIKNLGYGEALPVVKDPQIINPQEFIAELIDKRLPNKNIPDTPYRIATDTSQLLAIRYGVTLKHYVEDSNRDPQALEFIPLILAGWCRYLMGVNDQGQQFAQSPDPQLATLKAYVQDVHLGEADLDVHQVLHPILSNRGSFGNDLYEIGIGPKVEAYFQRLIAGPGAVRQVLHDTVITKGNQFH